MSINDSDVSQFKVEILIDGVKGSCDIEVVLQFDHYILTNQCLEEGVEYHVVNVLWGSIGLLKVGVRSRDRPPE